ncbi:hypothetical protein [Sedimentitalea nanhaiensis]|uniref:Uncharacterized protein n=1 Tax=Sedimentitalea nanhaiensis TaxID=999627 RepID=A0A1I6Y6D5_9RHOB|nr:hypothetical protein [Sedimentitalea nanhaiensis]SFT46046.1 hypothetical protein SAMN05216236_10280 [Sedimentitalea nanhaiensis]
MTPTVNCLSSPAPRTPAPRPRGHWLWVTLLLGIAVAGYAVLERTGTPLSGLKIETGSIPGQDWHGNVRRSSPGY